MRTIIQRVKDAEVTVAGETVGKIGAGLLVYLGIAPEDSEKDIKYLADKIIAMRIFEDENQKMNISLKDTGGEILCVSQFTLYADCRKGNRPSFTAAAPPEKAEKLYNDFCTYLRSQNITVATGIFAANMQVKSTNNGPVTIPLDI